MVRRCDIRLGAGFTLVELLVLIGVLSLLLSLVLAYLIRARECSGRVPCASNLRQIGQGILLYNNDFRQYPRTRYKPGAPVTQYTGAQAANPFAEDGPAANDVTAAMYLLIRHTDLNPDVFRCPSNGMRPWRPKADPAKLANFPGPQALCYSLANPYPDDAAIAAGYRWDEKVSANFAIAADMNPGGAELVRLTATMPGAQMRKGNSMNHERDGQDVLFGDGHVEWCTHPFVGADKDNIYTFGRTGPTHASLGIEGPPAFDLDSVLLPVASVVPPGQAAAEPSMLAWLLLSLVWVGIAAAAVRVTAAIRRRRASGSGALAGPRPADSSTNNRARRTRQPGGS